MGKGSKSSQCPSDLWRVHSLQCHIIRFPPLSCSHMLIETLYLFIIILLVAVVRSPILSFQGSDPLRHIYKISLEIYFEGYYDVIMNPTSVSAPISIKLPFVHHPTSVMQLNKRGQVGEEEFHLEAHRSG